MLVQVISAKFKSDNKNFYFFLVFTDVLGVTEVDKLDLNVPHVVNTAERTGVEPNITDSIAEGNHNTMKMISSVEIIDISDDDELQGDNPDELQGDNPDSAQWYYKDNEQVTKGPYPAKLLKRWKENGYFPQGLEVWKHGHIPLLLEDMIMQMFCN